MSVETAKLVKAVFRLPKGRILQRKRPCFASQKATFYSVKRNALIVNKIQET